MPSASTLIIILFPFVFIVFWCLVCTAISRCGWHNFTKSHTAFSPAEGLKSSYQSCTFNILANYQRCITFHVGKSDLRISVMPIFAVGHPALFFPWSKVRYKKESSTLFGKDYLYDLGAPCTGRIRVSAKIHRAIQEQS